ncbi:MAG: hypothetical protein ABIT20_20035 [Gemmatimonadaceae bacterium]
MRRFLALLALTALSACSQEIDQSTRPENIVGEYHLVTYGGTVLPATVRSDSVTLQVLDGTLILSSDGAWSEALSVKAIFGGVTQVQAFTGSGSWNNIREFAYISFYDHANNYQFSGTASGATIVLTNVNGDQLVYRR